MHPKTKNRECVFQSDSLHVCVYYSFIVLVGVVEGWREDVMLLSGLQAPPISHADVFDWFIDLEILSALSKCIFPHTPPQYCTGPTPPHPKSDLHWLC